VRAAGLFLGPWQSNSSQQSIQARENLRIMERMAQNSQNRLNGDRPRFAFDPDYEVRYWTERLGVSPEDVRAAVKRVRAMVQDSRRDSRR
jgi:hypothetical protein